MTILISALYAAFMLVFGVQQIGAGHGPGWVLIGAGITTVSRYGLESLYRERIWVTQPRQDPLGIPSWTR